MPHNKGGSSTLPPAYEDLYDTHETVVPSHQAGRRSNPIHQQRPITETDRYMIELCIRKRIDILNLTDLHAAIESVFKAKPRELRRLADMLYAQEEAEEETGNFVAELMNCYSGADAYGDIPHDGDDDFRGDDLYQDHQGINIGISPGQHEHHLKGPLRRDRENDSGGNALYETANEYKDSLRRNESGSHGWQTYDNGSGRRSKDSNGLSRRNAERCRSRSRRYSNEEHDEDEYDSF